ncbi:hypothetical protein GmHk_17G049631 [Glycine max]|nr:hypothetical protein GmHk_17G049631 [Glycine max]KAH1203367.1 hypothetical protein GmHk_17G049631 [Glycine max]
MATPPSSPPPPPPTGAASQSSSILKQTRKATGLRSLATRPVGAERPLVHVDPVTGKANGPHKKYFGFHVAYCLVVHVDPATGKADGPHKKKLRTYLGIIARDKVDVTYENWKQVPAAQKDLIWDDVQDSLEEQASQGSFATHGRQDVLIAAIGRPEHLDRGLALPPEPEVGPSAARVSTKESCVDPSGNDPDTGDSDKPVKVSVEEVRDADAPIPIPTEEGAVGPTKLTERPDHEVDDPLYLMTLTIPQLFLKPLQVMWDATVFGLFNEDFPLYIKHEDLSEIAHNGQCLIISIIQLWILHMTETSMRAGNSDVYGFHEPQSIQRSGQSQFES